MTDQCKREEAELVAHFLPLAENPAAYFVEDQGDVLLPLERLVSSRLRPSGVRNAARLMADAAAGRGPRRAAIRVTPAGEGQWLVVDGNSTVAVARSAGWVLIPCRIEPAEARQDD